MPCKFYIGNKHSVRIINTAMQLYVDGRLQTASLATFTLHSSVCVGVRVGCALSSCVDGGTGSRDDDAGTDANESGGLPAWLPEHHILKDASKHLIVCPSKAFVSTTAGEGGDVVIVEPTTVDDGCAAHARAGVNAGKTAWHLAHSGGLIHACACGDMARAWVAAETLRTRVDGLRHQQACGDMSASSMDAMLRGVRAHVLAAATCVAFYHQQGVLPMHKLVATEEMRLPTAGQPKLSASSESLTTVISSLGCVAPDVVRALEAVVCELPTS